VQDRLLAALAQQAGDADRTSDRETRETDASITGDRATELSLPLEASGLQPAGRVGRTGRAGRRWWYAAMVGAAAVILVAVAITALFTVGGDSEMAWEEFRELAEASVSAAIEENSWNVDLAAVPKDRKFPLDDFEVHPIGWRDAPLVSFDNQATAYLLPHCGRSEVVLLVTRSRRTVTRVTEVCPSNSLPTSGEQSVGAWRSGDYLFVLVVRGKDHRESYRSIIPRPQVG
jgi:hypothetical protein